MPTSIFGSAVKLASGNNTNPGSGFMTPIKTGDGSRAISRRNSGGSFLNKEFEFFYKDASEIELLIRNLLKITS